MKHEFASLPHKGVVGKIDNKTRIEGCEVREQTLIPDDRGFLNEIMRSDWDVHEKWGQVYATQCLPNVVKGWHYHYKQVDYFNCVSGMSKVVLFDNRENSSTKGIINEFVIGPLRPRMIRIPNFVWHGFCAIGNDPTIIINCPTEMYDYKDPDEFRAPFDSFDYNWFGVSG